MGTSGLRRRAAAEGVRPIARPAGAAGAGTSEKRAEALRDAIQRTSAAMASEEMDMRERRVCASPTCSCETTSVTCSLWCGSVDVPAGVRCLCRHDECLRHAARGSSPAGAGVRPPAILAGPAAERRAVA
jgi:hypothetical protein